MAVPELSLGWRCADCGRLHLASEPVPKPAPCVGCGGTAFEAVGPFTKPMGRLPDESAGVGWPVVERRKSVRN